MKLAGAALIWGMLQSAALNAASEPMDLRVGLAGLSDESYVVRERSMRALWSLGDSVLPELRRLESGRDPEAAAWARKLIRRIEVGILPDGSDRVVELVERFDQGDLEEKREALSELREERAFRQILRLLLLEKDADVVAMMEEGVRGVAVEAAQSVLATEPPDVASALRYLDMVKPEVPVLMAKASLHRVNGTLEEELQKSAADEGEVNHRWRYVLLASSGRWIEAAEEAEKAGISDAAMRLRLLAGDPLPWLRGTGLTPGVGTLAGFEDYREFAIRNWEGREVPDELLRALRRKARGTVELEQARGIRLVFLAGDTAEGEKQLAALNPRAAFRFFNGAERVDDALSAMGLDPEAPDFKGWVAERFEAAGADFSDGEAFLELLTVADFLRERGLLEEQKDAFLEHFLRLGRGDEEVFWWVTRSFLDSAAGTVVECLKVRTGGDEDAWRAAASQIFRKLKNPLWLWKWTGTLDPELGFPERMDWLLQVCELVPDPGGRRERFFDLAWKSVEKENGGARRTMLDFLESFPAEPEVILRLTGFSEEPESVETLSKKAGALTSLRRWKEAGETWQAVAALSPESVEVHVNASVCLRRAGEIEEADRHERRAELLALGQTEKTLACGDAFLQQGDFERAAAWWQRAAAECTVEVEQFPRILERLIDDAQDRQNWGRMAAYSEALAFLYAGGAFDGGLTHPAFTMAASVKLRANAGMSRAFSLLGENREAALSGIERWSALPFAETSMADHFFAPMRQAGLTELHDRIFEQMWERVAGNVRRFPEGVYSRNSAAWLASRANRRLDEAESYLEVALKRTPHQAAYLDTMAEVHFARRDREKAVDVSNRAVEEGHWDFQIVRQHERFVSGPFPPP